MASGVASKIDILRHIVAWPALLLLAACAAPSQLLTDSFQPLASDPRVRFEAGAEHAAAKVARLLPTAITLVETAHGRGFLGPVLVHVCGSEDCFKRHVQTPNVSAATVPDNVVVLAPQLFGREGHRLAGILTHELSHLHLGQQIGHYTSTVPAWFHEGLAAYAALGGGADYATDEQAIAALRLGKAFAPERRDTAEMRHTAAHWELEVFLFYRQALLFVNFLRQESDLRFHEFLSAVQDNQDFDLAFGNAYNMRLEEAGKRFREFHGTPLIVLNP